MILKQTRHWHFDGEVDPLKGPKRDTVFLKDNYKTMGIGSSFRTVKARFSPRQIHAGAKKAGFVVQITDETPWLKVTIVRKLLPIQATKKPAAAYKGAGKVYPSESKADIFS